VKLNWNLDCGSLAFNDEEIREVIKTNDPNSPGGPWKPAALAWAESIAFQPFIVGKNETVLQGIENSVTQDVAYLKAHPLIKESIKITGYVFDLETGKVTQVA
jgi:carbonic anhydrase